MARSVLMQSSSFSDLNAQRIRRKPPPTILLEERYPTPDPSDPFAPLWVLRNRTSSALGHAGPYSASHDSQDTLDNLNERKVIYSSPNNTTLVDRDQLDDISFPGSASPRSKTTTKLRDEALDERKISRSSSKTSPFDQNISFPASPSPNSKPKLRDGDVHKTGPYTSYSQMNAACALQAFPRLGTPHTSQTNVVNLDSPTKRGAINDTSDGESDASTASELVFRTNFTHQRFLSSTTKPMQRPNSSSSSANFAKAPCPNPNPKSKADPALKSKFSSTAPPTSTSAATRARQRFAKFLLPKKRSLSLSDGGPCKPSVSAPQAVKPQNTAPRVLHKHHRRGTAPAPIITSTGLPATIIRSENKALLARNQHRSLSEVNPVTTNMFASSDNRTAVTAALTRGLNPGAAKNLDPDQERARLFLEDKNSAALGIKNMADRGDDIAVDHDSHHAHIGETCALSDRLPLGIKAHGYYLTHEVSKSAVYPAIPAPARPVVTFASPLSPNKPGASSNIVPPITASVSATTTNPGAGGAKGTLKGRRSRLASVPPVSVSDATSIVSISMPEPAPSFLQDISVDIFASPRPAPAPPNSPLLGSPFRGGVSPTNANQKVKAKAKAKSVDICQSDPCSITINPPRPSDATTPSTHSALPAPVGAPASSPTAEWALPSATQITRAAALPVACEDGSYVRFGSLFAAHRTIVVFIRHFWCPLCQDYMSSLKALVRPEMLSRGVAPETPTPGSGAGGADGLDVEKRLVSFVVIGNGAHGMIRKYRQIFGLPFSVYTDPELAVYKALGMGKDGDDGHMHLAQQQHYQQQIPRTVRISTSSSSSGVLGMPPEDSARQGKTKKTGYVKHGLVSGIAMVVFRAIKVGMPVWEKGGDIGQLGGEFIFGPGLSCSFAHRMQTTKGHAPIETVLEAAGIDISKVPQTRRDNFDKRTLRSSSSANNFAFSMDETSGRRRHESMRTGRETTPLHQKRATLIRGDDRRYSTGIMSREEEEAWMAERQRQMEALQERKMARRGAPSRSSSAQESYACDTTEGKPGQALEAVGELSEERMVSEDRRNTFDSFGDDGIEDTVEDEKSQTDHLMVEIRRRLRSMTESCSTVSGETPERDPGFMDTDTEDELSSKEDNERPIGPTTSYLFIH